MGRHKVALSKSKNITSDKESQISELQKKLASSDIQVKQDNKLSIEEVFINPPFYVECRTMICIIIVESYVFP